MLQVSVAPQSQKEKKYAWSPSRAEFKKWPLKSSPSSLSHGGKEVKKRKIEIEEEEVEVIGIAFMVETKHILCRSNTQSQAFEPELPRKKSISPALPFCARFSFSASCSRRARNGSFSSPWPVPVLPLLLRAPGLPAAALV